MFGCRLGVHMRMLDVQQVCAVGGLLCQVPTHDSSAPVKRPSYQ